jgi:hypothetical protein
MQDTGLTFLSENSGLYVTNRTGTSMLFATQPVQLQEGERERNFMQLLNAAAWNTTEHKA